jgi:hypothetical protein
MTRTDPLSTYLNDHLAGSAGALDLLETLIGHAHNADFAKVVTSVAHDIRQDRETLLDIVARLDVEVGTVKQVAAKVAEKALKVKSSTSVTGDDDFSRLLALEALCTGILGKQAGWSALRVTDRAALTGIDFDDLIARATEQRAQLEPLRLAAAAASLSA